MNINICHKCKNISKIHFFQRRQNSYITISSGATDCYIRIPDVQNTKIFEINFFAKDRFYQTNYNNDLSMKGLSTISEKKLMKMFEKIECPMDCPYKFEHKVIE